MSTTQPASHGVEQLQSAKQRLVPILKTIEELTNGIFPDERRIEMTEQLERNLRELLSIARTAGSPQDLCLILAQLCSVVADKSPHEALELSEEFHRNPAGHDSTVRAYVADAVHIAYRCLGEGVRSEQHRAAAIRFSEEAEPIGNREGLTWQSLMAWLRSSSKPLAGTNHVFGE